MRLSDKQQQGIIQAVEAFIEASASLYLFGSRTKDHLKGGDIDLLLITSQAKAVVNLRSKKHLICLAIQNRIGEQKIDLKIALETDQDSDAFLQAIMPTSILLKKWK